MVHRSPPTGKKKARRRVKKSKPCITLIKHDGHLRTRGSTENTSRRRVFFFFFYIFLDPLIKDIVKADKNSGNCNGLKTTLNSAFLFFNKG